MIRVAWTIRELPYVLRETAAIRFIADHIITGKRDYKMAEYDITRDF